LCETGRFAHHPDYVSRAFTDAGFEAVTTDEAMLRLERRRPVMGCLVEARVP
jgi:predicted TPR repeat methyltransferase